VSDTGCGIQDEVLPHIFTTFTQGVQGYTRSFQGAGLGLAICQQLIRLMGGTMACETEVGAGTSFHFSLSFQLSTDRVHLEKVIIPSDDIDFGNVLLVEDDPVNSFAMTSLLKKAGYEVTSTDNGQSAIELYDENDYDFIIMDIQMPIMDGVKATIAIRSKELERKCRRIPIIALTSYAMEDDINRFINSGMDAHIANLPKSTI
jgi:CheY-like chemotaxis protein